MARITTTHRIEGAGGEAVTVAELRDFITGLPDDAGIAVQFDLAKGDWSLTASELPRPAKVQAPSPYFPPGVRSARVDDTPPDLDGFVKSG